jgi:hypothetical protein
MVYLMPVHDASTIGDIGPCNINSSQEKEKKILLDEILIDKFFYSRIIAGGFY